MRTRLLAGVPALLLLTALSACGDDESQSSSAGDDKPSSAGTSTETASGEGACEFTPSGKPARDVEPPAPTPPYTEKVNAVLKTSVGDLKVVLDADKAPCTVASFASLAEQGYYDNTSCHRQGNDPGFEFLQCGDPVFDPKAEQPSPETGTGGPGYTIPDEIDGTETYGAGTLAMANTGYPDSGGGQFFIVFGDSGFPPSYTVWGHLDKASLATLKKATASGNDGFWAQSGGGRPNTPVTFKSISIG
ncbi:peptidylprolyl isomerase [Nocardioides sp. zg-536]|uniref:Peptidylprolyl isomerase n=1 Tax=Nocardioides faecalis TaxID=2803858 RepID=A0A938Y334_9ACTN|nr:peptidylprolyl isomerase [Nocardioides faecalis]MBM9459093.1 peptidylprolyl isomerase [Nocardioides faecalis]QVI57352.1 peptidylprolyl isomerase [Nocardioides faecalis]